MLEREEPTPMALYIRANAPIASQLSLKRHEELTSARAIPFVVVAISIYRPKRLEIPKRSFRYAKKMFMRIFHKLTPKFHVIERRSAISTRH